MDKLTLDTNVIRDWIWCFGDNSEIRYSNDVNKKNHLVTQFEVLKTLQDKKACELGVSNQIYTDYGKDVNELPEEIEGFLKNEVVFIVPSITTFPFLLPASFVDKNELERLRLDVFPNSNPESRNFIKQEKDALQLYAHLKGERDVFITSDKGILRARQTLSLNWGIKISTLLEYINQYK